MYFRSFFTVLFLVLSSPTLACNPNSPLCSKLINPVILQLKDLNQFFVWVILGLLSLSILYLAYSFFIDIINFASKYMPSQIGEYVRLSDGTFVLAGSKQHQWLEHDGGTVHFSNEAFDRAHKTPFDWNDPALDYLGKEQPEIIGYNDKYFDDVWDRQAPIGNPEVFVSENEHQVEDESFVRHLFGIDGFIDNLF